MRLRHAFPLLALLICASLPAQEFQHTRSGAILLGDRFADVIWALNDFNFDFTTEQAGEAQPFYTAANGPALSTIQDMESSEDGRIFFIDSTNDHVVWLLNGNLDADADDPGESGVFFDTSNVPGIQYGSMLGLCIVKGTPTTMWIACSGNGSFSNDRVLLLRDANGDGDANDAGESRVFWDNPISTGNGNPDIAIPSSFHVDASGRLFILQAVNSGASAGVYELIDMNGDSDANDPGEVVPYFIITAANPAAFDMTPARDGRLFVADRGTSDMVYALEDLNNDGDVNDPNEAIVYWTPSTTSLVDSISEYVLVDGTTALLVAEDGGDDRVLILNDLNGNGVIDNATEEITLHNTANAGVTDIGQPKAICALNGPSLTGPNLLAVGQSATATHHGTAGHTIFVGYNFATAPILAPPYGIYHLGTFPPLGYSVPFATLPASGTFDINFMVPNIPSLTGAVLDSQSYEYDGFFGRLSELYRITVQ